MLSGCATPHHIYYANLLKENSPDNTCWYQADKYAQFLALEGGEVWIYCNEHHAWCVKGGKIYDSTCMKYTGLSVNHPEIKRVYGEMSNWDCAGYYQGGEEIGYNDDE